MTNHQNSSVTEAEDIFVQGYRNSRSFKMPQKVCQLISVLFVMIMSLGHSELSAQEEMSPPAKQEEVATEKEPVLTLSERFSNRDSNEDGQLSLEEVLLDQPVEQHPKLKRDFSVVDWNQDDALSQDEYTSLPGIVPTSERIGVPDPIQDLANSQIAIMQQNWAEWDQDDNATLSQAEFEKSNLHEIIPGLRDSKFELWNLNDVDELTQEEATQVVEAAFGVRSLEGLLIRKPNGVVFNWMGFRWRDVDKDGFISGAELQETQKLSTEEANQQIASFDTNQNGKLSGEEAWSFHREDLLSKYLAADTDLDGLVNKEEIVSVVSDYQKTLTKHLFPGFDTDDDGQLNFVEYRLSLLGNFDEPWHNFEIQNFDSNSDGQLQKSEFSFSRPLESCAIRELLFNKLDTSNDQQLDLTEFEYRVDIAKVPSQVAFKLRDQDKNELLSMEELQATWPEDQKQRLARDFQVVNWDGNNGLSIEEYLTFINLSNAEQRGAVVDPIQEIAQAEIATISEKWGEWDADQNDSLDMTEFSKTTLKTSIPGLQNSDLSLWDRNEDGSLSQSEAIDVIEMVFGIRSLDGMEIRRNIGVVFNISGFRYQDADKDGFIGTADTQLRRKLNEEKAAEYIGKYDQDKDLKISPSEAWPVNSQDVLTKYLSTDTDLNGLLSEEELLAATPDYQLGVASFIFPGFDLDNDQQLNFREYRLSPLANYDEAWHEAQHRKLDLDFDGKLSLAEFTFGRELAARALRALLFEHLDISNDQQLDLNEFEFGIDLSKVSQDIVFNVRDKNGDQLLTLSELIANQTEAVQQELTRDFQVVNWDGDEGLSLSEYGAIPRMSALEERSEVPDPILNLADMYLNQMEQEWENWDTNEDQNLDTNEFLESKLNTFIPGLSDSDFEHWDLDGGGRLEKSEITSVIEAAYGVRSRDGVVLRKPNGVVFNWMGFRFTDVDKDGFIGLEDLKLRRKIDEQQATEIITKIDQNQDGKLSAEEAWSMFSVDTFKRFLNGDQNFDGFLSNQELITGAQSYQQAIAPYVLDAFDNDNDGKLSLEEYRLSFLANDHETWHELRKDQDNDGKLSLEEFSWNRDIESRGMVAMIFNKLDVSDDERLDLDEFPFRTDYRDPEREFKLADSDENGLLSFDEFVSVKRELTQEKRDFQVFDENGDQSLNYEEYLSIPSRTSLSQRVAATDPIIIMADELLTELNATFAKADKDGDGLLTSSEFRNGRMTRDISGMQLSGFEDWDLNHDGGVSEGEVKTVIYAAYGINRLDGLPYREPSGAVFHAMLFKFADINRDDQLSQEEYLERGFGGDKAAEQFQNYDANGDGTLTFVEWSQVKFIDPLAEFLNYDKDFSGRLSHTEVMEGSPEWQQLVTKYYLSAFDDDDDGQLSLTEYRRVPTVNFLASWHSQRSDRDGDGFLSSSEFYEGDGVDLAILADEFFRRYDSNNDGKLSLQEFDFRINGTQAPVDISFAYYDEDNDNLLTLDELLGEYRGRTDTGAQAVIGRMEEMFLAADSDQNKQLSMSEFRAGREILDSNGRRKSTNSLSTEVARNGEQQEGSNRFWILIAFNVLLIVGVGWYALFR